MGNPLQYSVVITRPEAQANSWAVQLEALGFATTRLNLLEIVPVSSEEKIRAIKNKILDFDLYRKAIFVSQNAVESGMQWLDEYWPQLPMGIDYFAVGATTAKKLADYGVHVTDLAVSGNGGMTSEDLLRAPGLQQVDGEKIIIFRGCGGRGHMAEELRQRGAQVDYCELYERRLPVQASEQLRNLLHNICEQSAAVKQQYLLSLHSGESLENLCELLREGSAQQQQQLRSLPLLVPSQRVEAAAQVAGFVHTICAENATDQAMTDALTRFIRIH